MSADGPKRDYSQLLKDALLEITQLRSQVGELRRAKTEPIAIIGMSCRFPGGATNPGAFWRLLRDGVDAISEVPADRWDAAAYYDPDPDVPGTISTRYGGFLDGIDRFDPAFFGISPREARSLDPQQRLLLEVAWEALEHAAIAPTQLYGSATGVFVGMSTFDYALHQVGGRVGGEDLERIDGYIATGTTLSPAAGRLSYVLGLNGPSMVVDTACSSSLVATHLAVTSLRNRECDTAIVGGVNLILRPEWNVNFTKAHMLAPDGRCKTFDASADGYTRGEGCGVVVLQRLPDALEARRRVIAVIRGSAVNQDGASGGLTVPSGPSQEQVIRLALEGAGLRPEDVSYVEAHGTGTALGDPIEAAALGAVFGAGRTKEVPLRVGSVKTNIGHLEAAAGVAALIKVALSLRKEEIPPHLHFTRGNPMIDWDRLPISVPVNRTPWTSQGAPRRAGISSFGFTGTNAHLVLEQAPEPIGATQADRQADRPLHLLALSARTPVAVRELAGRFAQHLADRPQLALPDVAFTANTGRAHFKHRMAVVADSAAAARRQLAAVAAGQLPAGAHAGDGERPRIAFLFTGQGAQYTGMARQLYDTQPLFRATLDRCDEILRKHLDQPLLAVLYPEAGAISPIDDTAYTQPALFAIEYALAALWQSWGIEPEAVMGHSVGEYVAACVAGVFSLEDGLTLIAERARLMQALPRVGQMVAAHTGEERAAAALAACGAGDAALAAINGPNSVVISGAAAAVSSVIASMTAEGIPTQQLRVSHAFHSPLMDPMLTEFERAAGRVAFGPPARNIVSNVTGRFARAGIATPEYWVQHVRQPVRFAEGMSTLHEHGCNVFVEIGPASTLLALGRSCLPDAPAAWLPSLSGGGDWDRVLQSLAELYTRGARVDWNGFHRDDRRHPVSLPTYPFQRQRYWVDVGRQRDDQVHPRTAAPPAEGPAEVSGTARRDARDLIYTVEWREHQRAQGGAAAQRASRWLILGDRQGFGHRLAVHLQQSRGRCTIVSAGDAFRRAGDDHFEVDPRRPEDLERLWDTVSAEGPIHGVVHLWGLDEQPTDISAEGDPGSGSAVESALHVIGAIARSGAERGPAIWCVTRGAVAAGGEPKAPIALAQAPLWGFGRTVGVEHPQLRGGLIDLDPEENTDIDARALACELLAPGDEDQVAFRNGTGYVPRLVRRAAEGTGRFSADPGGTYLVTGGLGALGLHAARWLVSRGARTLVLAGRRGAETPGAAAAVQSLEAMGATVTVARADVCRNEDVERLLDRIRTSAAPLRGVVLAAGVDAPVRLAAMTSADLRSMLAAKLRGGWLLHDRTRGENLHLFICFSSVSAMWGTPGRAHYAAANAALDALAYERRRLGLPALSVNWGPWRGGGMGTGDALQELEQTGNHGIEPAAALGALDELITGNDVQAVVADVDWPRFRAAFEARRRRPLVSEIDAIPLNGTTPAGVTIRTDWIDQLQAHPPADRPPLLVARLRAEIASVLGYSDPTEVPVDRSIVELGMDSLRAVELAVRLQRHLGLRQPVQVLECATMSDLACRLLRDVALWEAPGSQPAAIPVPVRRTEADGAVGWAPELEPEIFEFVRLAWPQRPEHLIEPRWRWMFLESAARCGVAPRIWLYRQNGKVVAHHGAMPVQLQVGSELIESAWFADTMVLESHRAAATGAHLIIESNDAFPVGLSLGQTRRMREIALRLGWEQVGPLQTYVLLLRPRRVLSDKLPPLLAGAAGLGLHARQALKRRSSRAGAARLAVRPLMQFDADHDRLWDSVKGAYPCAVTRDASYLNWKYTRQPGQDFVRLEFSRDGDIVALAVLALDEKGPIYSYRRALIVELVVSPSDAEVVNGVLDAIRERCTAAQVDAILVHVINTRLERHLEAYGFMRRQPTRFLLVGPGQTSAGTRRLLLTPDNWLVTMGDCDIDRPWEVAENVIQRWTSAPESRNRIAKG